MRTPTLILMSSLLLAAAPAGSQEPPPPPSAQLQITSATSGVSAHSWVSSYTSETCEGAKRLANFNFVKNGDRTVSVGIGQRIWLQAYAYVEPPVGSDTVGKTSCRGMASFVPENGKVYGVKHDLKTRNCPLLITDAAGAPPATYEKSKPKGPCKKAD